MEEGVMRDPISPRRNLESLKKEAKRWLDALQEGEVDARDLFARAIDNAPATPSLRDVQHALAREHGFDGWTALKNHLSSAQTKPRTNLVDWFLENACPDHHVRGGPAHVRAIHTAMRLLDR